MSNQNEFLWKKNTSMLSSIKVAVRRHNIPISGPSQPIERRLGDPKELIIHYRPDEGIRPIFARDDVVINPPEDVEARSVYPRSRSSPKSDKRDSRSRSHSQSCSRSYRTWKSRSQSYSPPRGHSSHKSKFEENDQRRRDKRSRSPLRPAEWQRQQRKRSRTPLRPGEYRPTSRERELQRSRKRSRSPPRKKSKERDRKRSKSPLKPSDYRPDRPSTSYHRSRSRSSSLDRKHRQKLLSPNRKIYDHNSPKKSYESSRRRSPTYRKSRSPNPYRRKQGRSRSRERHRSRSKNKSPPPKSQQHASSYMEHSGIMQGYPYYEGAETGYWIPPGVRPGFIPPMYAPYPPPGAMRPIFYPPRMMLGPYPGPRPRLPIYNSRHAKKYTPTNVKSATTEESTEVTINEITDNAGNEKGESSGSAQNIKKDENNEGSDKEKEDN